MKMLNHVDLFFLLELMVHLNFSLCYSKVLISISTTNIIFKNLEKNRLQFKY